MPRLIPRDTAFYDLLCEGAGHLVTGCALLREVVEAPPAEREPIRQRMRAAEHAADETTHATIRRLNSSFVTPFDREDIHRLSSRLDDVMDHMDAAADLVVLYRIGDVPPGVHKQIDLLCQASTITADSMPRLRTLAKMADYLLEVNRLENEADRVHRDLLAELFSGHLEPLEVMKLKDVVEELEAAADALERVAHVVEAIVVKES